MYSEYMLREATATSNRVCVAATICEEDETEFISLRVDADRVCGDGPRPSCDCTVGEIRGDGTIVEGTGTQWEVAGSNTATTLPTCNVRRTVPPGNFEPQTARMSAGFCFNDTAFRPCTALQSCAGLPMDVIILMDASNSIELPQFGGRPGRFAQMKAAVISLVSQFDISPTGTHVSLITYGDRPSIQFSFNR